MPISTHGINIIVTCSNRKSVVSQPQHRLRSILEAQLDDCAAKWTAYLQSASDTIPTRNMYQGEHWSEVTTLEPCFKYNLTNRIWVCSAGYGLIHINDYIASYSATFAPGNEDSVWNLAPFRDRVLKLQDWWSAINSWPGPSPGNPRTITALAQKYPHDTLVLAASNTYLSAIQNDLVEAVSYLSRGLKQLLVISCGSRSLGELTPSLLPCDARLQHHFPSSTRVGLNSRVLREVLLLQRKWSLESTHIHQHFAELLERLPAPSMPQRLRVETRDVRLFIEEALKHDPAHTHTALLRQFRNSNRACEQAKFRDLYMKVKEELNGCSK